MGNQETAFQSYRLYRNYLISFLSRKFHKRSVCFFRLKVYFAVTKYFLRTKDEWPLFKKTLNGIFSTARSLGCLLLANVPKKHPTEFPLEFRTILLSINAFFYLAYFNKTKKFKNSEKLDPRFVDIKYQMMANMTETGR